MFPWHGIMHFPWTFSSNLKCIPWNGVPIRTNSKDHYPPRTVGENWRQVYFQGRKGGRKGKDSLAFPLFNLIFLFLTLVSNLSKKRTELVRLLFCKNHCILSAWVGHISYWHALLITGVFILHWAVAFSYQRTHVHRDPQPVRESIRIGRNHQCSRSARSCRFQGFHTRWCL